MLPTSSVLLLCFLLACLPFAGHLGVAPAASSLPAASFAAPPCWVALVWSGPSVVPPLPAALACADSYPEAFVVALCCCCSVLLSVVAESAASVFAAPAASLAGLL